jgi:hypothetical protein
LTSPFACCRTAPKTIDQYLARLSPEQRAGVGRAIRRGYFPAVMSVRVIRVPTPRADLAAIAEAQFGDMLKAVVDVRRRVMAVGGELHSDEEATLLEDGSRQDDLWGINIYPGERGKEWIEFDSVINIRPSQGNRSRGVEDGSLRQTIPEIVGALVTG